MVSVAVRTPTAVGEKATLNAQVACAARELPQALTTEKSPGETLAAINVSGTPPLLVSVMVWAALVVPICCTVKFSVDAERVSVAGAWPIPESDPVWVAAELVPALSVTESVAERVPLAVGVKVIESVHPVPAARVAPQVLANTAKSPASPLSTGADKVARLPPVLETVMFCDTAVWFTMVAGKLSVSGVSAIAAAAVPVPLSETVA